MRSANPALKAFDSAPATHAGRAVMTVRGTIANTSILLGICAAAAIGAYTGAQNPAYAGLVYPLFFGGMIAGLVLGLVIVFKPRTAPFLAPVYAAAEGLFVGVFSLLVTQILADRAGDSGGGVSSIAGQLIFQALALTIAVTAAMLAAYATRIIRPGRVFRAVVVTATGGVMFFALAAIVLSLFGNNTLIGVYSVTNGGMISVGFSLLVVVIAALNLVLDFEFIERGAAEGAPKHMEWVGAFALLVTLVWLYIEILRLLAKLRSGD